MSQKIVFLKLILTIYSLLPPGIESITCVLFPFAMGQNLKINQKEEDIFHIENKIDKNLFKYLRTNILIPDEKNTRDNLFKF